MIQIKLNGVIDWLKTKPLDGTYRYTTPDGCMYAQYLESKGATDVNVGPEDYCYTDAAGERVHGNIPRDINWVAQGDPYGPEVMTYGEALNRAQQLLEGTADMKFSEMT